MLSHYVNVSTGISFPMFVLLWDLSQKRIKYAASWWTCFVMLVCIVKLWITILCSIRSCCIIFQWVFVCFT